MRMSDWSSDVCSSDLAPDGVGDRVGCAPGFRYEEEDQLFCAFGHLQRERLILVFALPCLDGPDPILWRRVGRTTQERRWKQKFRSLVLGQVGLYGKQVIGFKRGHCINGKRDPVALHCYTQPRTGKVERRRFSYLNLRKRQCRQDRDPQEAEQRRQIETQRHDLRLLWDFM